jgi:hypothetical protein
MLRISRCEISGHFLCCFKAIKKRYLKMASQKTKRRTTPGQHSKGKTRAQLERLLRDAHNEVEKLLQGDEAGTLSSTKLRAGLEEIKEDLDAMEPLEKGS